MNIVPMLSFILYVLFLHQPISKNYLPLAPLPLSQGYRQKTLEGSRKIALLSLFSKGGEEATEKRPKIALLSLYLYLYRMKIQEARPTASRCRRPCAQRKHVTIEGATKRL